MRDNQGGGESDPAEGVRKRCMKNFPSEDGAPERLGCGTVKQEVSQVLQRMCASAA